VEMCCDETGNARLQSPMRRADRLFRIVQILRRRSLATARQLAEELEVSERTVYRDVADLGASGVPIRGEAGVGYAIDSGYDLPPLMFTVEELEALILGARMVIAWCDPDLTDAAKDAVAKVEHVLPQRLRERMSRTALFVPNFGWTVPGAEHMSGLRSAIRDRHKVRITYSDAKAEETTRTVHPLGLFFWGAVATVGGWCELRADFRTFRVDRIEALVITSEEFETPTGRTVQDYFRVMAERG